MEKNNILVFELRGVECPRCHCKANSVEGENIAKEGDAIFISLTPARCRGCNEVFEVDSAYLNERIARIFDGPGRSMKTSKLSSLFANKLDNLEVFIGRKSSSHDKIPI